MDALDPSATFAELTSPLQANTATPQSALAGRLLVEATMADTSWRKRQVETLRFERSGVRRSISCDCDVAADEGQVPVPIAQVPKADTLVALDAKDESGAVLPFLTYGEERAAAYAAVRLAIALTGEIVTEGEDRLLLSIIFGSSREAESGLRLLFERRPAWFLSSHVSRLLPLVGLNSLVCPLLTSSGRRQVVTVSWEETVRGRPGATMSAAIKGRHTIYVALASLPSSGAYHVECFAPQETRVTRVVHLSFPGPQTEPPAREADLTEASLPVARGIESDQASEGDRGGEFPSDRIVSLDALKSAYGLDDFTTHLREYGLSPVQRSSASARGAQGHVYLADGRDLGLRAYLLITLQPPTAILALSALCAVWVGVALLIAGLDTHLRSEAVLLALLGVPLAAAVWSIGRSSRSRFAFLLVAPVMGAATPGAIGVVYVLIAQHVRGGAYLLALAGFALVAASIALVQALGSRLRWPPVVR